MRFLLLLALTSCAGVKGHSNCAEAQAYLVRRELPRIGSIEKISFGDLAVEAKIDTGAATSSIHATGIELFEEDGKKMARFTTTNGVVMTAPVTREDNVKSSNGTSTPRTFVQLAVKVGKQTYDAEFSLAERSAMKYPVLLGAAFLRGKFLVDVEQNLIHSN